MKLARLHEEYFRPGKRLAASMKSGGVRTLVKRENIIFFDVSVKLIIWSIKEQTKRN